MDNAFRSGGEDSGYQDFDTAADEAHALQTSIRSPARELRWDSLDINQQCQMQQSGFIADVLVMNKRAQLRGTELSLLVMRSNNRDRVGRIIRYTSSASGTSAPIHLFPSGSFQYLQVGEGQGLYITPRNDDYLSGQATAFVEDMLLRAHKERAESVLIRRGTSLGREDGMELLFEIGGRFRAFPAPAGHLFDAIIQRLQDICPQRELDTDGLFRGRVNYAVRNLKRTASCIIRRDAPSPQALIAISRR